MDGHELDRGHPECLEVRDGGRVGDAGVGAADLLRDVGVQLGQALHVGLVDHGVVVLVPRRSVVGPVEERVGDDREHRVPEAVVGVDPPRGRRVGVAEGVGEERLVVVGLSLDRLGVGVEEQLGRVAPVTTGRVVRTMDPEAVALSGLQVWHVPVPDESVDLGQVDARPERSSPSPSTRQSSIRSATSENTQSSRPSRRRSPRAGRPVRARSPWTFSHRPSSRSCWSCRSCRPWQHHGVVVVDNHSSMPPSPFPGLGGIWRGGVYRRAMA